jgi:hypothetical protein
MLGVTSRRLRNEYWRGSPRKSRQYLLSVATFDWQLRWHLSTVESGSKI